MSNTITRRTAIAGAAALPLLSVSAYASPNDALAHHLPTSATDAAWETRG